MKREMNKLILILLLFSMNNVYAQTNFITTWKTNNSGTSSNSSITIPTNFWDTYNYSVDWDNDGTMDETGLTGDVTHDFGTAGEYTIQITGTFPSIYFHDEGDKEKLIDISQWGSIEWESMNSAFYGCANMDVSATDAPDLSNCSDMFAVFRNATIFSANINHWDVSNISEFSYAFANADNFNQPLDSWNTISATKFISMFYHAALFNQDISDWNTSSLNWAEYMFYEAGSFDQNLGDWNVTSVSGLDGMFERASLTTSNYDSILIGWASQSVNSGLNFHGGNSTYCLGSNAYDVLDNTYGWTITDDGQDCGDDEFIFVINRTGTDFTIPTKSAGSYDYHVDWDNDGVYDEFNLTGDATHSYSGSGIDTILIVGTFSAINFNNGGDKDLITDVIQWGTGEWSTMNSAFYGCSNLTVSATDAPDLSGVTNIANIFRDCSSIDDADLSGWNVSTIKFFTDGFRSSSFDGNVSTWSMNSAISLKRMFRDCSFNQDISGWSLSSVTSMLEMFRSSSFNQDISGWDVSLVSSFNAMFRSGSFDQNIGNWDISSMSDASEMLYLASLSTENYDSTLIGWQSTALSAITLSGGYSTYCAGEYARNYLTSQLGWTIVDAGLDGSCNDVTCLIATFEPSNSGTSTEIYIGANSSTGYAVDWDNDGTYDEFNLTGDVSHDFGSTVSQTIRIQGDFDGFNFQSTGQEADLVSIDQWGAFTPSSYEYAFSGCEDLVINATDEPNFGNAISIEGMFEACTNLSGNFSNWNLTGVTNTSSMFVGCRNFNEDLSSWVVSDVTDMSLMFSVCNKFNSDLSGWNVEKVESVSEMFSSCSDFNGNLSSWNLASVTNLYQMFNECYDFNSDISNWNLENAETISEMFYNAISFNQDLRNWDVGKVTDMSYTFEGASDFDQNLGDWDISTVTTMNRMFNGITMSTSNYDSTLIGWAAQIVNTGVVFDGGSSGYCLSIVERSMLQNNSSWTISDGDFACSDTAFVFTVNVTGTDFTIPTNSSYTYNYHVDWENDGEYDDIGLTGDAYHDYGSAGTYTIAVIGEFPAIYFNNNGSNDDITDISQWGKGEWQSFESAFYGCSNLNATATDVPDLANCTSMENAFREATSFDSDLSLRDISTITNMTNMLNGVTLSTSNYDDLLTSWAAQTVQSGVTFDAGNSQYCSSEEDRNTLTNTPNSWIITDAGSACTGDPFIITIENSDFTIPTNSSYTYDYHVDWDNDGTYDDVGLTGDAYHDYGSTGTYTIAITGDFPAIYFNNGGNEHEITEVNQWGTTEWESFEHAFEGCENLTITANDKPDFSRVVNGSYMFEGCINLSGNFTDWDLTGVTTATLMFEDCTYFNEDISGWNVSTVESFYSFFDGASSFNQDISAWNVTSATSFFRMFQDAVAFDKPLNDWDVSKVTSMGSMFYNATSFNQNLSDWETTSLTNIGYVFYNASSFNGDITTWNTSLVSSAFRVFENSAIDQNLGNWDVSNLSSFGFYKMLDGVTMSTSNYDSTLIGWAAQSVNSGVYFGGGDSKYCLAITERSVLADDNSWEITDGGFSCEDPFTFTVNISGTSFTIPTNGDYAYNYHVDWDNDGTYDDFNQLGDVTHDFGSSGTYTISVVGFFPSIYFNNGSNKEDITDVSQWGGIEWKSM